MTKRSGSLLVLGTSSGAGKSTVVTGICRWLRRQRISVAPFKAQNMSLNSYVTNDGGEMGRAQVVQAQAAGVEPEVIMNPVLLKPGTDRTSQLIVLGHPVGDLDATKDWHGKESLLDVVVDSYRELKGRFDVVICEGAGSPAEINLRKSDIVNLGFARAANVPALLVGDIDRGGVFASFVGTLAVLEPGDQLLIRGFIVNKFRGSVGLLQPGLAQLADLTGRSTLGVLPFRRGLELDAEDATDFSSWLDVASPLGDDILSIGVLAFPRASNLTDFDPLVDEPGVVLRPITRPEEMETCDLVILPGTRATASDLAWLRERGFAGALLERAARGRSVLGLCGGYQMLGEIIDDEVEGAVGRIDGLGLLPVHTEFKSEKVLTRTRAVLQDGSTLEGYEIHHGRVHVEGGDALFADEGCIVGSVGGTLWHGLFENDAWRREFLVKVADTAGKHFVPDVAHDFAIRREARIDVLADLIDEHVDTDALWRIIEGDDTVLPTLTMTRQLGA
ncbi:MAG TPA: cobyric acid synthase [Acidimicrobiales bacterium]|nr:cobyric acid synthase [Acidimicrobiales bacterium]